MTKKAISIMLVLLMVSPFSILAKTTDELGDEAMVAASANPVFLMQSEDDAPVITAGIEKGKINVELPQELAAEHTILVNVGMEDISDSVGYVGTGSFRAKYYGRSGSYVMPGEYQVGTLEFINETGETYQITDYSFSDGWVYNIGRIYNDAARAAGLSSTQTKELDDEAWYQLNYDYFQLEENAYNLNTLRDMFGHGGSGQGSRIATENHPEMKKLAHYYLFHQMQFTFDQTHYAVNSNSSKPNTQNIITWDYIQRTEENENLVYAILSAKEIGGEGLTLDIGANSDNDTVGNAYNGAYGDFGFTLTLTRVALHTVTYDANGATSGDVPIDNEQYQENDEVTVKGNEGNLEKTGYTFAGWTFSPDGSGAAYNENDVFTMGMEDVTLYAKWSRIGGDGGTRSAQYTVFYRDKDNHTEISPSKTASETVGTVVTAESVQLAIAGYEYVDASAESITVSTSGENVITLYYKKMLHSENREHMAYVIGYPDDTFRPENYLTRAEAAIIFYRLLEDARKQETAGGTFRDVKEQWYAQAVNELARLELLGGYEDNTFRPDAPITRAELAALIARFGGLENHPASAFRDVPEEHWAAGYIGSVASKGWMTELPDGLFRPEEGIARAQAVILVNQTQERNLRREDVPPDIPQPYSDTKKDHWAFSDIMEASISHLYVKDAERYETWRTYSKRW